MDKQKIKRTYTDKKTVPINIRISLRLSKWLKENDYSPTGIFQEACNDLGFDQQ